MALTKDDIVRDLRAVGVGPGMTIMVHSSLSALGQVEGGATVGHHPPQQVAADGAGQHAQQRGRDQQQRQPGEGAQGEGSGRGVDHG